LLYFSAAPVKLDEVDPAQYAALSDFKKDAMRKGLIEQYESLTDFKEKLTRQLSAVIYSLQSDDSGDEGLPSGTVAHIGQPEVHTLSPAAEELLLEASKDKNGTIMFVQYIGGTKASTNGRELIGDGAPQREIARWRGAIQELESLGYIEDRAGKGQVYFMTHAGYTASDDVTVKREATGNHVIQSL